MWEYDIVNNSARESRKPFKCVPFIENFGLWIKIHTSLWNEKFGKRYVYIFISSNTYLHELVGSFDPFGEKDFVEVANNSKLLKWHDSCNFPRVIA